MAAQAGYPAATIGAFCAQGSWYDGANCQFGKPTNGQAFVWNNGFYSKAGPGNSCSSPQTFDSANCFLRKVPSSYAPFLYNNYWYTEPNAHYVKHPTTCPSGFTYDGANCHRGAPPSGRVAKIRYGKFGFKRSFYENCSNILSGADGSLDPWFCKVHNIPPGHKPFVHANAWYVEPTPWGTGDWWMRTSLDDSDQELRPLCRADTSSRDWVQVWSEDFNDIASGTTCYTSSNEAPQCVYREWWGFSRCSDAPFNWTSSARKSWAPAVKAKYLGIANLNKCRWVVYDQFNQWDNKLPVSQRAGSFTPANIEISNGTLKMGTVKETKAANETWDCGRELEANPAANGHLRSKRCPHSGANISSQTNLPWTAGNNPNNADPNYRYTGLVAGYGRVEFRARINAIGHGAWPALWLWGDDNPSPGGIGELDALEYLADISEKSPVQSSQIVSGSATAGIAMQTAHNWGVDSQNYPHIQDGVGIPIAIGEWHTYAVEYDSVEIRMYVDGCLRNRLREGDSVYIKPWDRPQDAPSVQTTRPFKLPGNKNYHIIIGSPASAASFLPSWYRAYGGLAGLQRPDFVPTHFEVDYVRYFARPATTNGW